MVGFFHQDDERIKLSSMVLMLHFIRWIVLRNFDHIGLDLKADYLNQKVFYS